MQHIMHISPLKVSPLLKDAAVLSYLRTFHCVQREHFQSVFSAVETTAALHLVQIFTSLVNYENHMQHFCY